jgi:hypothetical protein
LTRRSTLPQLLPKLRAILARKQERNPALHAIDILAAVCRAGELARSAAVAIGRALEDDCQVSAGGILELEGLCRLRGWSGERDGLGHGDAVGEGEEQGGVEDAEDREEGDWFEGF